MMTLVGVSQGDWYWRYVIGVTGTRIIEISSRALKSVEWIR